MVKKVKKKKLKLNKKRVIQTIVIVILVAIVGGASVFAYNIYKDTEEFSADRLLSSGASQVFDDQGNLIYTYGSDENGKRQNVTYDDLPQVLVDAVVAAEDSRFFEHDGFDLPRIAKAAITNLMAGKITGGGSTITQQLIKKTYFPNAEKSYTRKISEIFLAIKADKALSKEEILTLYLNKIYFGRSTNSIGIGAACKYYFNKDVSEITLPEAALLAGSLNSPYNYDPYYNLNKATERRNTILNLMVTHGYITQEECDLAKAVKIENTLCSTNQNNDSYLAAYIDLVTKEVIEKTEMDPREVQMNIYTFCNTETQKICTDLNNGVTYDYSDEDLNMAGSVQSSQDGRIIAILGGRNYQTAGLNYATVKQQPGSSVKPFLDYGLAFEYLDWCTGHSIQDEPIDKGPKNWDNQFHGSVTIPEALEQSWNVPAYKTFGEVMEKVDKKEITNAMESIGISMEKEEVGQSYSIGGWKHGISPIEMASAYATISNNGMYAESHTINYIDIVQTGDKITVDEDIQDAKTQSSYSEASSFMIRQTMIDYTGNGSGSYAYLSGIDQIGAKTGTSNFKGNKYVKDNKSKDIWMTGYTPDYICSVWMAVNDEGVKKGKSTTECKAYPGKVVSAILKHLSQNGYTKSYPDKPDDVVQAQIVKGIYPYVSPSSDTPADNIITAWFKKGTTPSNALDSDSYTLNNLSSFDASLDSSNKINVTFSAYNPIEATTNDQTNDATKLYGKVVYTVVVSDANSGATLHTQNFSTNTGTVDYTVTGQVKVTGYYSFEKAPGKTSNKIEKVLGSVELKDLSGVVSANGATVSEGSTINTTSITVTITPQNSNNSCSIVLCTESGEEIAGTKVNQSSTGYSDLTPGSSYIVVMSESDGSKTVTKRVHFSVAQQ